MTAQIKVGRLSLGVIVVLVLVQVVGAVAAARIFRGTTIQYAVRWVAAGVAIGFVGYLFALRSMRIEGRPARVLPRTVAALALAFGGLLAGVTILITVYGS